MTPSSTLPASLLITLIPLAAGVLAYLFRRWRSIEVLTAVIGCGLVIVILSQPVDATLQLPGFQIEVGGALNLLGRTLGIRGPDRLPLVLLFASAMILFGLSWRLPQGWLFTPLGLGILSLASAGLMIRPFVFAGLAFETVAAFAAVMIQSERSGPLSTIGAQRYLVSSTLALPAFLGAGYVIGQAADITDPALQMAAYQPAALLLAIGFALLVGAVPLYTWTHAVANQAPPLTTAFLATVATGAVTFLFLEFKQEFAWFRGNPDVRSAINLFGVATLLLGGVIAWAQRSWSRILACCLSVELGATLLMLNYDSPAAVEAIAFSTAARGLSLGVFGAGLSVLRSHTASDHFERSRGFGRRFPLAALAIALGSLSLAGLPGMVGFVTRWLNVRVLSSSDLEVMMITLLASIGIGWGVLRGLMALLAEPADAAVETQGPAIALPRGAMLTLSLATLAVVVLGLVPGPLTELAKAIASAYSFYP